MESKDLKKLLAGIGIASLISAGGLSLSGCASSSGWTADKDSAGSAVEEVEKKAGDSGWTATKDSAGSAAEKAKKDVKKKAGDSGWTATK